MALSHAAISQQAERTGACPRAIFGDQNQRGITDVLLLPTPTPSQYVNAESCIKRKNRFCTSADAQDESGFRTGGAGLVLVTLRCFDAECGSCGTSDLRLLVALPFVDPSV